MNAPIEILKILKNPKINGEAPSAVSKIITQLRENNISIPPRLVPTGNNSETIVNVDCGLMYYKKS